MGLVDSVEKMSYGQQKMIKTLCSYKLKEDLDFIELTNDATKEYH